jgi:hypothetical protein
MASLKVALIAVLRGTPADSPIGTVAAMIGAVAGSVEGVSV